MRRVAEKACTSGEIRTHNLPIRSRAPCPLGHGSLDMSNRSIRCPMNRHASADAFPVPLNRRRGRACGLCGPCCADVAARQWPHAARPAHTFPFHARRPSRRSRKNAQRAANTLGSACRQRPFGTPQPKRPRPRVSTWEGHHPHSWCGRGWAWGRRGAARAQRGENGETRDAADAPWLSGSACSLFGVQCECVRQRGPEGPPLPPCRRSAAFSPRRRKIVLRTARGTQSDAS